MKAAAPKCLSLISIRRMQSAGEDGDFVLHDLAEPVAEQSPVHDVVNRDRDFDKVGAAAVFEMWKPQ